MDAIPNWPEYDELTLVGNVEGDECRTSCKSRCQEATIWH